MKHYKTIFLALSSAALLFGCSKDEATVDTAYPTIDLSVGDAFPKQCSILQRGEKYIFKAYLNDNVQLGALSVDIHHNFDQHTHSTEVNNCGLDPVKKPVKPFLLIQSFPIPTGLKTYQTNAEITVPADVDPGDYHFMIRLTDKEGWQTIKGLSIKIR
ncbi:DUF4625 domain-containing protein [Pedobacter africanus]|uniref:DUF4625 domain-containing protein n=1 Tax=Pedobacter africanus TaxID=151894 RepID=A0A1W2E7C2_9SPHI|nr:DUF4625 domain-containing protein [Pedobacter africanus]SMD05673.1 protein of unknown function [Pedobacter africanus]